MILLPIVVWLCGLALPIAGQAASLPAVEAENGMIVSSQYLATKAGIEILKKVVMPLTQRLLLVMFRPLSIRAAVILAAAVL